MRLASARHAARATGSKNLRQILSATARVSVRLAARTSLTARMWNAALLSESVPNLSRVAILRDPSGGWGPDYWREAEVAAAARELTLLMLPISG
jgi:hypothetical protein